MLMFNIQSLNIYSVTLNHLVIKIQYEYMPLTNTVQDMYVVCTSTMYLQYSYILHVLCAVYCSYSTVVGVYRDKLYINYGFYVHVSSPLATM